MRQITSLFLILLSFSALAIEVKPKRPSSELLVTKVSEKSMTDSTANFGKIALKVSNYTAVPIENCFLIISSDQFCAKYKIADYDTISAVLSDLKFDVRIEDRKGNILGKSIGSANKLGFISYFAVYLRKKAVIIQNDHQMNVRKPVIYCYNESELEVSMNVNAKADIGFVYPTMNSEKGWDFTLSKNSIEVEGKKYPYLFWEGNLTSEIGKVTEGVMVNTDTIVPFLERCLDKVGFNSTEATDFITYWAPILSEKEEVFLTFLQNKKYSDEIASLEISPKPETLIRLFMVYDFDFKGDFEPQTLHSAERKGFTVTDWGGGNFEINKTENL